VEGFEPDIEAIRQVASGGSIAGGTLVGSAVANDLAALAQSEKVGLKPTVAHMDVSAAGILLQGTIAEPVARSPRPVLRLVKGSGGSVTFSGLMSWVPGNVIVHSSFDFGDGDSVDSDEPDVRLVATHRYGPGSYTCRFLIRGASRQEPATSAKLRI